MQAGREVSGLDTGKQVEKWFIEYGDDIYNYLVYHTGSLDVEDMVQEVFIKALKGAQKFKGLSTPKTWLFTIARNIASDYYRKKGHLKLMPYDVLENSPCEDAFDAKLEFDEDMHEIYTALKKLKKSYRDVVILRGIRDLSPSETAEILNWNETRVNVTLHRALKALRKQLSINQKGGKASE